MKLTSFQTSFCLLALILLSMCTSTTASDKLALLSFKSLLTDPHKTLASWSNDSLNVCRWRGVTCGGRHPHRVTALDLGSLGLDGPISPSITNLTFLQRVHLPNNNLYGSIPQDLGRLSRLKYLNLSMNSLDGKIPTSLSYCSHLEVLSLRQNNLQGEIPSNLSRCSNLQSLGLGSNRLSGEIPAEFGSLQHLQTLRLEDNYLYGSIPALLGSSVSLRYVNLPNNRVTGIIPPFLANSSSLIYLDLSKNNLTGPIPPALGNNSVLQILKLSDNSLSGEIPDFLSSILVFLGISTNQLTGKIPDSLRNISSLGFLYIASNFFHGSIPETIGSIPMLKEFDFSLNNLSGEIPPSLYNISSIAYFAVGNNNLSGVLPSNMGLMLPNLQTLEMRFNRFRGPIPVSLCNASYLQFLFLPGNNFSGPVPSNLGSLQALEQLYLGSNQLESHDWSFFTSLTNCRKLKHLLLQDNMLEGQLPVSIGNLSTQLQWLLMGKNKISGIIPEEIGNLSNLTVLYMNQNRIHGTIPGGTGKLQNLHVLDLSGNKLSGTLPSFLGNLTQLNELYMQENNLSGRIPPSFGLCINLGTVNLSHNSLSGNIPKEVVRLSSLAIYLDLSHNSLNGYVPTEVGMLVNLEKLDFSYNQLTGEIPSSLGNCVLLQYLYLEKNFFRGEISQSLKTLKGLNELDLSSNNLSGQIPEFLGTFLSLQYLNLSFNDLDGELPKYGVFSNASGISVLGNKGLCGGDPTLQLPSCPVQSLKSKGKFPKFLIVVISVTCALILSLALTFALFHRLQRSSKKYPSYSHSQDDTYIKVSYAEILKATNNFSPANIIGSGSFGIVYRGNMSCAEDYVAVKVLNDDCGKVLKSFIAECEVLRNTRHRNLIKVITACSTVGYNGTDFKALIYEYMPNGSLDKWLHPEDYCYPLLKKLDLNHILNIATDVAPAHEYLHHNCTPPVVHCDLKPSNVLLDDDMTARLGDFGLARFLLPTMNSRSSTGVRGSIGYVAPVKEYGMGNIVSIQGDVYSYGILLLEMLTGKRPTNDMFKDGINLNKFVKIAFPDNLSEILDPRILQKEAEDIRSEGCTGEKTWKCITSLIRVGLSCSNESPRERMEMRDVANVIRSHRDIFSKVEIDESREISP